MVARRSVLAAAGGVGLLGAAGLVGRGAGVRASGAPSPSVLEPVPTASLLDEDPVAHLVRRLAPAPSVDLVAVVRAIGESAWLEAQLDPPARPGPGTLQPALDELALETMTAAEFVTAHRAARDRDRTDRDAADALLPPPVELAASLLLRRVVGDQPVLESMVELWSDVLHVHIGHDAGTRLLTPLLVRDVLRPHALGRFDDLLVAVTTSPAMLLYLDGGRSRLGAVNENHARELLELHTVGVGAHDEDDVAAVARVLTGWVVDPNTGASRLVPRRHDDAVVEVLDWRGVGAADDGEDLLRHLAQHPDTAERVARALAVRFVSDDPSPGLVAELADVYLDADTAIVPVLRALVGHAEFAAAPGAKLRRPMTFATAALAGVAPGLGVGRGGGLLRAVAGGVTTLGHSPLGWPAPDGYPDVAPAWVSSAAALGRWALATDLAVLAGDDWLPDVAAVLEELPRRMLLEPLSAPLLDELAAAASAAPDPVIAATALVLDLPASHLR